MPASANAVSPERSRVSLWVQAVRAFSFTASVIPVLLGGLFALGAQGTKAWYLLPLAVLGGLLLHAGTNLINDYYDFKNGVDRECSYGSSGVLVASGLFGLGYRKVREVDRVIQDNIGTIDSWLIKLIDPERRAFSLDVLLQEHGYPDDDHDAIDGTVVINSGSSGAIPINIVKDAIFEADETSLKGAKGVGHEISRAIVAQAQTLDVDAECNRADALGARILTWVDSEYPAALKEIHDPPLALYVLGSLEKSDAQGIAIVGTRRPTHYGKDVARQFASQLARMRFSILSGLALGIDTVAHRAALDAHGRTIAVLGSALDTLYPPANADLAREIAQQGAVISELPLGRRPDKTTFPMRNRIVSGMSKGVLVIEAGHKSGALITARQANEQGRTVFAVPGRIDAPGAQGCLHLIRDGATMVTCIDDIVREYEFLNLRMEDAPTRARPAPVLDADESILVDLLKHEEQHVDALIRASGMNATQISTLLLALEMKKVVRMLPGKSVALVPSA